MKTGRGYYGDSVEHARIGRLGGLKTLTTHDKLFYSQMGKRGGRLSPGNFANRPVEEAVLAGRKGGLARAKKEKSAKGHD